MTAIISLTVLLLNILGEDEDTWRNDLGVLTGTRLDIFSEESSKEIKVRVPRGTY